MSENQLQAVPSRLEQYNELTLTTVPMDKQDCTELRVKVNAAIKEINAMRMEYKNQVIDEFDRKWQEVTGEVSESLNTKLLDVKNTISVREQEERKQREADIKVVLKDVNKQLGTSYKYAEISKNNKLFTCAESRLVSHITSQIVMKEDEKVFSNLEVAAAEPVSTDVPRISIIIDCELTDATKKFLVSLRKQGINYRIEN